MRLIVSALLVVAGLIVILWVNGSAWGVEANTIGGTVVLLGLVSALVAMALRARRDQASGRSEDDEPVALTRK